MAYTVPGMALIPQTMGMSCWYASAQMVIQWRRNRFQMCEEGIVDPSEDSELSKVKDSDSGISDKYIVELAKRCGLRAIPPMSPTEGALEGWLQQYGPLWVNGKTHIVVIAGIRSGEVLVYDPAPVDKGQVDWRSLSAWYIGNAVDSRDTTTNSGVFLYCPA